MQSQIVELKKFLIDSSLINKKDVEDVFIQSGNNINKFVDILVSEGKISEDDMRRAKAYVLGIPYVDLKKFRIDKDVLTLIPEPIARNHNIVAYNKSASGLEVAMMDPEDLEAITFIKKSVGLKILPRLTDSASIKQVLLQYQKSLKAEFGDILSGEISKLSNLSEKEDADELKKLAEDLPVVKIVDTLLSHASIQKASDIHIEPFENELVVRYRIDGILREAMILPKIAAAGLIARIKVLANLRLDEKRLPQDGRFRIGDSSNSISFRVSILPTLFGEKVVMRLLPDTVKGFSLEQGGFHGDALEKIYRSIRLTTGMILVTGPTGSGKSTTLYTIMQMLNTPDVNISTIEDPIEYQIPRINQTQVKPDIGLTFAAGLRSLVRQDPDIIMVGEIRDGETINLAVNASLTGHLVLSTLHTNSASSTLARMVDMGAEPFLLVSTINVIIGQRLVRKLCSNKEKYFLTEIELKELGSRVDLDKVLKALKEEKVVASDVDWSKIPFYKPKPSDDCLDGFSGRIGIHEVLMMSAGIKQLIMAGKTADEIEEQAKKEGMLTMLEDGIFLAASGLTTIEEVFRVIAE